MQIPNEIVRNMFSKINYYMWLLSALFILFFKYTKNLQIQGHLKYKHALLFRIVIALSKCNSIISTPSPYDSNFTTINKKKETDLCKHISVDMISC